MPTSGKITSNRVVSPLVNDLLDFRQGYPDIPGRLRANMLLLIDYDSNTRHMQKVPFLAVTQFAAFAFDLLAPVEDFLIFGIDPTPIDGVCSYKAALLSCCIC